MKNHGDGGGDGGNGGDGGYDDGRDGDSGVLRGHSIVRSRGKRRGGHAHQAAERVLYRGQRCGTASCALEVMYRLRELAAQPPFLRPCCDAGEVVACAHATRADGLVESHPCTVNEPAQH